MEMMQICAWCAQENPRNIQLQKPENPLKQVSHGICQDHARRLRNSYRRSHTSSRLLPLTASCHS